MAEFLSIKTGKKNKLLFVAPLADLNGGANASLFELLLGAKRRGYKLHVVLPASGKFSEELTKNNIDFSVIKFSLWHPLHQTDTNCSLNTAAIEKISSIIEASSIEVVITNTLQIPWGALAAAYTNKPHVWVACEFPCFGSRYLLDHYDFINLFSTVVLANSKELARYLKNDQGITRVKHFYSYVDESKISLNNNIAEQRLVCVSSINSNKNQLVLIKAVNDLLKAGKPVRKLLLIGDYNQADRYVKEVIDFIAKHRLEEFVTLAGYKQSPFSQIGPNDIFVQTSMSESIGRTLIESMKLGLVCLGADIAGTHEGFKLGGGILFHGNDYHDLATKISDVIADFSEYKQAALVAQKKLLVTQSEKKCHDLFFAEIDRIKTIANPNYALRHLRPYYEGTSRHLRKIEHNLHLHQNSAKHQKQVIDNQSYTIDVREKQLEEIVNSKAWKAVKKLRRIIYGR